jgi:hypothetical protein
MLASSTVASRTWHDVLARGMPARKNVRLSHGFWPCVELFTYMHGKIPTRRLIGTMVDKTSLLDSSPCRAPVGVLSMSTK